MSKDFPRQMWWLRKLGKSWRRPRGKQNKLRQEVKSKGRLPKGGYRTPRGERGLHPSGLQEVYVSNASDVSVADPQRHAIRIGAAVGTRKRLQIAKACEARGLRVLNLGKDVKEVQAKIEEKKKAAEKTEKEAVQKETPRNSDAKGA